ncbi:MAG: RagB/SusD family nutrient uptake outer membrane protein [Bacteroides xylanisolvens]
MMKKIIILLMIVVMGFQSCDVEVSNPNALTTTDFWETEQDVYNAVNSLYNQFYRPTTFSRWIWFRTDLASDEGYSRSPWSELQEWTRFTYYNYDFYELQRGIYADYYKAIFRANQVINNIDGIDMTEENKNVYLAQAHFFRAFYYYHLAIFWGSENKSLVIYEHEPIPEEIPETSNVEAVWAFIENDLNEAIANLPEEWATDQVGRATKGAAYAMKAKALMQQRKYSEAQKCLEWLVTGSGAKYYGLVDNFRDNFMHTTENNIESVFEIQFSDENGSPAGDADDAINPNMGHQRAQFFGGNGIGWADGESRGWLVDEFKKEKNIEGGNDIRLKWSLFYKGMSDDFEDNDKIYRFDQSRWNEDAWNESSSGNPDQGKFFIRKYATDYYRDTEDSYSPINIRYIRYADILLLYAECLAQTGGSLSDAVGYVNRVRARANMPNLEVNHPDAVGNATAFLKRLQMERSLELCHEGKRWEDLKRWGMLDTQEGIDELKTRDSDFNYFIVGRHQSLPIPTIEINNNTNLDQNPKF